MKILEQTLPIIVNNYAKRFGIEVYMHGTQAYTDGKVIHVPRLKLDDPNITKITYAYLAHESAHVRFTDFKYVKLAAQDNLLACIYNILEDSFIEKKINKEYVGVFENLEFLRNFSTRNFNKYLQDYKLKDLSSLLFNYMILYLAVKVQGYSLTLRVKCAYLIKLMRKYIDRKFLNTLNLHLNLVKNCKKSKDCYELAQNIYKLLTEQNIFNEDTVKQDLYAYQHIKTKTLTQCICQECDKLEINVNAKELIDVSKVLGDQALTSFQNLIESYSDNESNSRDDFGFLKVSTCKAGSKQFIYEVLGLYPRLRRVLRQRAIAYVESMNNSSYSGCYLNMNKAILYKHGETNIFKQKQQLLDFNTLIYLLVDVSGSMLSLDDGKHSRATIACQSALSLALALENIEGIKNICSFFPGFSSESEIALDYNEKASKKAAYFDQSPRGSTPIAQALWHALYRANILDCQRNIFIIFTDGMPDSLKQLQHVSDLIDKLGIELYVFGIRFLSVANIFKNSIVINDINELPLALSKLLNKIFTL